MLPGMLAEVGGEEVSLVSERPMLFHPLAPGVKCPNCGAGGLTFIRARGHRDLYQCTSGVCKRQVMHYRNKETQTCGYAAIYNTGVFGVWTACSQRPPACAG
jgi:ssDNA-binding Zn-finger/Zn-ribbon topoisomerase 1